MIKQKLVNSAHDLSEGGLLIALMESCFTADTLFGVRLSFPLPDQASKVYFGEAAGRILISANPLNQASIKALAEEMGIECQVLGQVTDDGKIFVNKEINIASQTLHASWWQGLTL